MITAATMHIKSQTGRICSLNLITGTHADRKTSTHSVCLRRPMSADQHCGGETVADNKLNNPNLFFLVNQQMEEVMNGTFVWLKFFKRL